jgi:hypothetical protein
MRIAISFNGRRVGRLNWSRAWLRDASVVEYRSLLPKASHQNGGILVSGISRGCIRVDRVPMLDAVCRHSEINPPNRLHVESNQASDRHVALWPGKGSVRVSPRDRHVSVPIRKLPLHLKGFQESQKCPIGKVKLHQRRSRSGATTRR